ncbi:hypothetical protein INT45_009874 [Circinella minor]|uniref:PIPK domain-containing protein n=1 Tax=Circinella minor TaxID=1195481 RepID=A0A8H7RYM5_9FUNG|nr:hypothetical protein INT45_009874 [Circinella minor]
MNAHVGKAFSKSLPALMPGEINAQQRQQQQRSLKKTTTTAMKIIKLDEASRNHLYTLMESWLTEAGLPSSLTDTLFSILMPLIPLWNEAQQDSTSTTVPESSFSSLYESIHIQTLVGSKTMKESKFLTGVYHGEPLSTIVPCDLGGSRCQWLHHMVGGTLQIYGAPSGPVGDQLIKIVAVSIYTLWSLWLEMYLVHDFDLLSTLPPSPPQHGDAAPIRGFIPRRRSGIINWLCPKSNTYEKKTIMNNKSNNSHDEKKGINNNGAITTKIMTTKETFSSISAQDDPHRFAKLRQRLEKTTLLSSSPHCHFPAPQLIIRLQDEEDGIDTIRTVMRMKNSNASQIKRRKSTGLKRRASSLLSLLANNNNDSQSSSTSLQQQGKLQSAPTSSAPGQQQLIAEVPQSISAYSSLRCCINNKKIGMDDLLLDIQSTESFLEHQHIILLYEMHPIGCSQSPCAGPFLSRLNFFQYENGKDRSLGDTILNWCIQCEKGTTCNTLLKSKLDDYLTESPTSLKEKGTTPSTEEKQNSTMNNTTKSTLDNSNGSSNKSDSSSNRKKSAVSPNELTTGTAMTTEENVNYNRRLSSLKLSFNGCQKLLTDHIMTFSHGPGRVVVYITKNNDNEKAILSQTKKATEVSPCSDSNKTLALPSLSSPTTTIDTWFTCSMCEAETSPKPMSFPTYHYSIAKFIELILYHDTHLAPSTHPSCGHSITSQTSIIHCFQPSGIPFTVKMSYEPNSLYELRPPRLQVVPDDNKNADNSVNEKTSVVSMTTLKNWQGEIRDDVNALFEAVDTHIKILKQFIIAESKRMARGSTASSKGIVNKVEKQHELQTQLNLRQNELASMKRFFEETEHPKLILELHGTSLENLNDYRRLFALRSAAILSQLSKWQEKWCSDLMDGCTWEPPDYIKYISRSDKVHAFPGSSVLVREEEPSSIIAYTLSSSEYIKELKHQQQNNSGTTDVTPKVIPLLKTNHTKDDKTTSTTFSDVTSSAKIPSTNDHQINKKNQNHANDSNEQKKYTSINNQQQEKDNDSAIKSIENDDTDSYYSFIKRKFVVPNAGAASETASFRSMVLQTVKANASELHYQQQRKLQDIKDRWTRAENETTASKKKRPFSNPLTSTSQRVILNEPRIERDITTEVTTSTFYQKQPSLFTNNSPKEKPLPPIADNSDTNNSSSSSVASPGENRRLSPHIKHKFTCIVYYASEFETLRRQSGVDQLLIQSLSRCDSWKATGGKSKSHFYRSQDGRLVIKEMVNAWNNVEKESILKFAPKYFDHMKKAEETPSVLAKIFGFYTIRIRSTTDKRIILNLDVLVMEHLFYGIVPQSIQKFDFKGIRDRHVEVCSKQGDTTLWDGDWLQDYRLQCPVSGQSKTFIEKAIKSDTEFLTKGNIMDYSLLLGVDEAKKELTVGIVGKAYYYHLFVFVYVSQPDAISEDYFSSLLLNKL